MKNKGISLIVLIITIVVIIILATAIIVNLAQTNIIGNANEAVLKQDVVVVQEMLNMQINEITLENREIPELYIDEMYKEKVTDRVQINKDNDEIGKIYYATSKAKGCIIFGSDIDINQVEEIATNGEISLNNIIYRYTEKKLPTYKNKKIKWYVTSDKKIVLEVDGTIVDSEGKVDNDNNEENTEIKDQAGLIADNKYKINDEILEFEKIITVGENEAYTTVKEAFDYLCDNGYKEGSAILLKEGTYDTRDIHTGNSYSINPKYNGMSISIIADKPGSTFITPGELDMSQNNKAYAIALKYYRVIFNENVYGDGFHLNGDKSVNEYYNCVFKSTVGGWNGNVSTSSANVYNSLFIGGANGYYSSNPLSGIAENCASTTTTISPANGTKTTCLTNITVDSNYNITSDGWKNTGTGTNPDGSQANIGIYGGKYAWDLLDVELDRTNKSLSVNTDNIYGNVKEIKYMYGTIDENKVLNKGITITNKSEIENIKNGIYTFVVKMSDGRIIKRNYAVENLEVNTSYKINNETLEYRRIVNVGTNEECKTVKEAFDYLYSYGYTENGAILLKEGTHDTKNIHTGNSYSINPKYNGMSISIIADKPGSTFITPGELDMSQNNTTYAIALKYYRVIFNGNVYGDGFHLNGDKSINEYYNCVFIAPVGGWNGNVSTSSANVYNSLFIGGANGYYSSNPLSGIAENCASTTTVISPAKGTKTTCLTNITVDSRYNITSGGWKNTGTGSNPDGSQANIGVYGGKYAW